MKLLVERGFQTEGEAVGKIQRAKQSEHAALDVLCRPHRVLPASSGRGAQAGSAFDLAKYHEAVLSHGTLPVKYLPELVK